MDVDQGPPNSTQLSPSPQPPPPRPVLRPPYTNVWEVEEGFSHHSHDSIHICLLNEPFYLHAGQVKQLSLLITSGKQDWEYRETEI
ncbi:hypothetical protein NQZ68_001953 [Dissostichus eleginoides]|nr:hypothetical protein NQZ68_001953 [Dissostichus eleginoides]